MSLLYLQPQVLRKQQCIKIGYYSEKQGNARIEIRTKTYLINVR